MTRRSGYTPEEFYEDPYLAFKMFHPDDNPSLETFLRKEIRTDVAVQFRIVHQDGSVRWVEQKFVPILNSDGEIVAVEGIGRDITELKEKLLALQTMQNRG